MANDDIGAGKSVHAYEGEVSFFTSGRIDASGNEVPNSELPGCCISMGGGLEVLLIRAREGDALWGIAGARQNGEDLQKGTEIRPPFSPEQVEAMYQDWLVNGPRTGE